MSNRRQALSVLLVSTLAFTVCFMVWMMFAVIGIPIRKALDLNSTQFGLLMAMPVLTGSLIRVPLGMWTDKYGGRVVMVVLLLSCVIPIWLISYATQFWQYLVLGLFVGVTGGSFSVGTPYVARWFPRKQQGFAMGIYGAGNAGAAVNKFLAPALLVAFGWAVVPQVYAAIMFGTAILFWMFSHSDPRHLIDSRITWREQLLALREPKVWKYCQYYSIVFGGYVALSLWMVQYYVGEYGMDIRIAALLAACFSLPGGVLRAMGGWLSDKVGAHALTWWVMWVSWICLFILSYPQTDMTIATVDGPKTFHVGLNVWVFTLLIFILGIAWAFGKASVFKYIADDYPTNIGVISGVVGLAGGMGGWLSDKVGAHALTWWVMWVSWICLFLLSYPQTEMTIATINGPKTFVIGLNVWVFTFLIFILGIAWAFGKASVFKYIADDYPDNIGVISGVVGLAGGMGGFILPIMFGALMDLTGIRSSAFMLMYGVVWVSLIWMYWTEVRGAELMGPNAKDFRLAAQSSTKE